MPWIHLQGGEKPTLSPLAHRRMISLETWSWCEHVQKLWLRASFPVCEQNCATEKSSTIKFSASKGSHLCSGIFSDLNRDSESFLSNLWLEITYLPFVVYYVHTKFHKQKFHQDTSLFVWLFDQLDLLFFNFFPALVTPMVWAGKQFWTQRSFFGLGGATTPCKVAQKQVTSWNRLEFRQKFGNFANGIKS